MYFESLMGSNEPIEPIITRALTTYIVEKNKDITCLLISDPFIELHIWSGDAFSEVDPDPTAENFDSAL